MQLFVVGAPRSGTTIVTQTLNASDQIKLFDEVSLLDVLEFGESIVGKLRAFLMEREAYEDFRVLARETDDPAAALRQVMAAITAPRSIWGEKNPMYATQLESLRRCFPEAVILFVLRDPREVVNSYLSYRDSPSRSHLDFWIKDSVSEALDLVELCLEAICAKQNDLSILRYEQFIARPQATLNRALSASGVQFSEHAISALTLAPETVGDSQFFRRGTTLPWKAANLLPLQPEAHSKDRIDPSDPAWIKVENLARRFGYA